MQRLYKVFTWAVAPTMAEVVAVAVAAVKFKVVIQRVGLAVVI